MSDTAKGRQAKTARERRPRDTHGEERTKERRQKGREAKEEKRKKAYELHKKKGRKDATMKCKAVKETRATFEPPRERRGTCIVVCAREAAESNVGGGTYRGLGALSSAARQWVEREAETHVKRQRAPTQQLGPLLPLLAFGEKAHLAPAHVQPKVPGRTCLHRAA